MPRYGQAVIGPPGSGKTTYCNGMQQYLRAIGRQCLVINLDPANESYSNKNDNAPAPLSSNVSEPSAGASEFNEKFDMGGKADTATSASTTSNSNSQLPYDTILDVCEDIVNLSSVMAQLNLGPNGGLLYCMEYIHKHVDVILSLLQQRLDAKEEEDGKTIYLLIDFPGQMELYTHNECVRDILHHLVQSMDLRLSAVQLVDVHHCMEASKFISSVLWGISTMIRMELPQISVLSKMDLLLQYCPSGGVGEGNGNSDGSGDGGLAYNIDFFTDLSDVSKLLDYLDGGPPPILTAPSSYSGTAKAAAGPRGGEAGQQHEVADDDTYYYADDKDYQRALHKRQSSKFYKRHFKLHAQICDVIQDYNLLSFVPLDIQDATSVGRLLQHIDTSNGYIFLGDAGRSCNSSQHASDNMSQVFHSAIRNDVEWSFERIANIQEKYMGGVMYQDTIPELETVKGKEESE